LVRWHSGGVGLLFRLAELLLLIVPLVGVVIAAVKTLPSRAPSGERPRETGPVSPGSNRVAQWRSLTRVVGEHDRTDTRWLDYELDHSKLLDFPLMTDMTNPLTVEFHKAKLRADFLRPAKAEDLLDDPDAAARYLSAVEDYVTAFNIAEAEAKRTRRNGFSPDEQQRIARARSLLRVASDAAATPQERRSAYEVACRELDGLLVLPPATQAGIERGISGELDG
jgi:hypothetical protein